MKIRTDFVTNSSSSGFVVVTVKLKNGETHEVRRDWLDDGWGGYFSQNGAQNEENVLKSFDQAKNGADVLDVLREAIDNFDDFVLNGDDADEVERKQRFVDLLNSIQSMDEITSIKIEEEESGEWRPTRESLIYDRKKRAKEKQARIEQLKTTIDSIFLPIPKEERPKFWNVCFPLYAWNEPSLPEEAAEHDLRCETLQRAGWSVYGNNGYGLLTDAQAEEIQQGEIPDRLIDFIEWCMKRGEPVVGRFFRYSDFLKIMGGMELPKAEIREEDYQITGKTYVLTRFQNSKQKAAIRKAIEDRGGVLKTEIKKDTDIMIFGGTGKKVSGGVMADRTNLNCVYKRIWNGQPMHAFSAEQFEEILAASSESQTESAATSAFFRRIVVLATAKLKTEYKAKLESLGTTTRTSPTDKTDYVVIPNSYVGYRSPMMQKIEELQAAGCKLQVITKRQLQQMLAAEDPSVQLGDDPLFDVNFTFDDVRGDDVYSKRLKARGATVDKSVVLDTDYVVYEGKHSSYHPKVDKAMDLQKEGHGVQVLTVLEFEELLRNK